MEKHVFNAAEIAISQKKVIKNISDFLSVTKYGRGLQELSKLTYHSGCERLISSLLFSHLLKCEAIAAGGAEICIQEIKNDSNLVAGKTNFFSKKALPEIISAFCDNDTSLLVAEAVQLAGLNGKIVIASSNNNETDSIELTFGSSFEGLSSSFEMNPSQFQNARILCVDGFVESVAEIHHLLEKTAELSEPVIAFCRGFSDDVIHTLKVNFNRKTLVFIPVVVKFDLDGANLLNDIAVVSGGDVFSTHKGNLINTIDVSTLPRVDLISLSFNGITIENKKTSANVDLHISFLQKKILESNSEVTEDSIKKRIQRLGMNQVTIRLINDSHKQNRSFMIDRALRAIKISSSHGIVEYGDATYPLASVVAGRLYAKKFIEAINQLGALVC